MCYNYSSELPDGHLTIAGLSFSLEDLPPELLNPIDDGFDYDDSLVLRRVPGKDDIELLPMEWGYLPDRVKNRQEAESFRRGYKTETGYVKGTVLFNTRGEEMLNEGKMFRKAAQERRCLVPASAYYEYQSVIVQGKRGKPLKDPVKFPYRIFLRERPVFYFAGVYNAWVDTATGEVINTFSIVTIPANEAMKIIHNEKKRMPVILSEQWAIEWIDAKIPENRIGEIGTYMVPYQEMEYYTVSKDFKKTRDGKTHVHYDEVPEIKIS